MSSNVNTDVDSLQLFPKQKKQRTHTDHNTLSVRMSDEQERQEDTNVEDSATTFTENQDEDETLADVDEQHDGITTTFVSPTTQNDQYENDSFVFDSDGSEYHHEYPMYGLSVRFSDDGSNVDVTNLIGS